MEKANLIVRILFALSLPVILLSSAVRLITSPSYIAYEYGKQAFPADIYGFAQPERQEFAQSALNFVRKPLPAEYLSSQSYQGEPLYTEREVSHMLDVQSVFQTVWKIWGAAILLALATAVWLLSGGDRRQLLARSMEISGTTTAAVLLGLGLLAVVGWDTWFAAFHKLFFLPGSWVFDPSDTLIRLFPLPFWFDSALLVIGLTIAGAFALVLVGRVLRSRWLPKTGKQKPAVARQKRRQHREWPVSVYAWMLGTAFAGYVLGMVFIGDTSHPLHWAAGLFGLVLGCWFGWMLIFWKERKSKKQTRRTG